MPTVSFTIASELETLPNEGKKAFCRGIVPFLSQGMAWVAKSLEYGTVYLFCLRHPYQRQHFNDPEYVIKEVFEFGFTNDRSLFAYLSDHNILYALSLQSGTIVRSVSGAIPLSVIPEGQASYYFGVDKEAKTLFLKDFPCDFLKHFLFRQRR